MIWWILLLNLFCSISLTSCRQHNASEITTILRSFNHSKYTRHVIPPTADGETLKVEVSVYLIEVVPVRHRYYQFEIDLFVAWNDPRLKFNSSLDEPIPLSMKVDELFWQPDLWIVGENSGKSVYVVDQSVRLHRSGYTRLVTRLNLEMFCPMEFWMFPFDRQSCNIIFESYGYNNDHLALDWHRHIQVGFSHAFNIVEYEIEFSNATKAVIDGGPTGMFDRLILTLQMKRSFAYYVSQHLLPFNLVVILSMITFWIDHNCVPARVTIPLIIVLTLTKLTVNIKAGLPFSRKPIFLEIYLNVSLVFVLAVLLEYCIVGLSKIKSKEEEAKELEKTEESITTVGDNGYLKTDFFDVVSHDITKTKRERMAHPIDRKSRKLYPLTFLLYNTAYFTICGLSYAEQK